MLAPRVFPPSTTIASCSGVSVAEFFLACGLRPRRYLLRVACRRYRGTLRTTLRVQRTSPCFAAFPCTDATAKCSVGEGECSLPSGVVHSVL